MRSCSARFVKCELFWKVRIFNCIKALRFFIRIWIRHADGMIKGGVSSYSAGIDEQCF